METKHYSLTKMERLAMVHAVCRLPETNLTKTIITTHSEVLSILSKFCQNSVKIKLF